MGLVDLFVGALQLAAAVVTLLAADRVRGTRPGRDERGEDDV
ncbi:hypothetical protein [Micromonospora sp. NPDC005710]